MNRIDRLVAIIVFLQSKRIVRGREIASNFEISLRTVYRDMNALLEAGVPIISEAGEGYSIIEGYHLPPVMFTPEEAKALLTGAKLAEYMTDESLVRHAKSALLKINSVLPLQTKEELERLQDSMRLIRRKNDSSDFRDDVLLTIQNAIISKHVLQMEYYVYSRDEWTKREVEPLGLIHYADRWNLLAWCRKRQGVRDFRSDRLRLIYDTNEKYKERSGISLKEHYKNRMKLEKSIEVKIQFEKRMIHHVREQLGFGATKEEQKGNDVILTLIVPNLDWLVSPLLSLSNQVKILAPKELKTSILDAAKKIINLYKKK